MNAILRTLPRLLRPLAQAAAPRAPTLVRRVASLSMPIDRSRIAVPSLSSRVTVRALSGNTQERLRAAIKNHHRLPFEIVPSKDLLEGLREAQCCGNRSAFNQIAEGLEPKGLEDAFLFSLEKVEGYLKAVQEQIQTKNPSSYNGNGERFFEALCFWTSRYLRQISTEGLERARSKIEEFQEMDPSQSLGIIALSIKNELARRKNI